MQTCRKSKIIHIVNIVMAFTFVLSISGLAADSSYPTKPVTLNISYGAGGTTDVVSRVLGTVAQKILGQPITFINKPGGGGTLVLTQLKGQKPDGYNLGVIGTASVTRTPHIMEIEYDPWNDFDYIIEFGVYSGHVATIAGKPYKTFEEFINYARENPGKISVSTTGPLEAQALAMHFIAMEENLEWSLIPYDSAAEAMTALLGGHVDACSVSGLPEYLPQIESGEIVPLICFNETRNVKLPNTETLIEKGYGVAVGTSMAIVAPKGLPEEIFTRLENVFLEATQDPDFIEVTNRLAMPVTRVTGYKLLEKMKENNELTRIIVERIGLLKAE